MNDLASADTSTHTSHYQRLEKMYASAPINQHYQSRIQIGDGTCEIAITISREVFHAGGSAHGAVYFKLLDDAAFFASQSKTLDYFVLTSSFHLNFMRPMTEGPVVANGRWLNGERRVFLAEATITDQTGRELARGSGSFMRSRKRLESLPGYQDDGGTADS
ncbi:MAG: PaaI family thioesterase [Pseudomonadota bacterium]